MSGIRSFVALELPDDIRARLRETRSALLERAPDWSGEKWVAEEGLHITLKFLGNLQEDQLANLCRVMSDGLAGVPPFQMALAGVRAVPGPRHCSMVWARFHDANGVCAQLAASVDRAAVECGMVAEQRPFTPHVTLVRARRPRKLPEDALTSANAAALTPPISMSVSSATLFSSTLTRTGAVYEAIGRWPLPTSV